MFQLSPLSALKEWTAPMVASKNYAAKDFAMFAPKVGVEPLLGKPYKFTPFGPFSEDQIELKYSFYSSNR